MAFPLFLYPGRHIALSCSVFMVVAISAERHKAICYPLKHRPPMWQYVVFVVGVSALQNVPKFLEFTSVEDHRWVC